VEIATSQITCCVCNVLFCVTESHKRKLLDSHAVFYCPAGHVQHFTGENTEERLKRELAAESGSKEYWRKEAEWYRRSKIAYKGLLTREKNNKRRKR
jgi:hypothetical protein